MLTQNLFKIFNQKRTLQKFFKAWWFKNDEIF